MRFADPKPPFCACCFQHSNQEHIDFEAAWDGPVLEADGIKIPVDDLIVCADCVRRAAELLGMDDPRELLQKVKGQEKHIEALEREVEAKDRMLSDLTYTTTALAEFPIKRRQGKPAFTGVPEDVRQQLTERRKRQRAQGSDGRKTQAGMKGK